MSASGPPGSEALARQVGARVVARDATGISPADIVAVFHRWIRDDVSLDAVSTLTAADPAEATGPLIDVTDYSHVAGGPGVLLIAHGGEYSVGDADGRFGLQFRSRRDAPGPAAPKFRHAVDRVLAAARQLERDLGGRLTFRTDEVWFRIDDRLLAPNRPDTLARLQPALLEVLGQLYDRQSIRLEPEADPRAAFAVRAIGGHMTLRLVPERARPSLPLL